MSRRIIRPPTKAIGLQHKLVADCAKAIAKAQWEELATHDNAFYAQFPDMEAFTRRFWHQFIRYAKENLAEALNPQYGLSEHEKNEIYEALKKNAAVNPAINSPLDGRDYH